MLLLSLQILLINFLISGFITALIYLTNKRVRHVNPLSLYIISSLGTFIGTLIAMFLPSITNYTDSKLLNSVFLIIPGITLSVIFIKIWVRGSKAEGYI